MLVRGKMSFWLVKPEAEDIWNDIDWARARTLEARWLSKGVLEEERRTLLPCAIWLKKFPGTGFRQDILERLRSLEKN